MNAEVKEQSVYESPVSGKKVVDRETQTVFTRHMLSPELESMITKIVKYVICLSYNFIGQDCELMKHFAGPTLTQFEVLYDFF